MARRAFTQNLIKEHDELLQKYNKLKQQVKKNMTNEKKKVGFKEVIETTAFLGFVFSFLFFMWFYPVKDITLFKWIITIWCVFWGVILVFGFNKGSILAFGAALIKVATDKTLKPDEKLALIMIIIQEFVNIAADLSQMINLDEEKRKILEKKNTQDETPGFTVT